MTQNKEHKCLLRVEPGDIAICCFVKIGYADLRPSKISSNEEIPILIAGKDTDGYPIGVSDREDIGFYKSYNADHEAIAKGRFMYILYPRDILVVKITKKKKC